MANHPGLDDASNASGTTHDLTPIDDEADTAFTNEESGAMPDHRRPWTIPQDSIPLAMRSPPNNFGLPIDDWIRESCAAIERGDYDYRPQGYLTGNQHPIKTKKTQAPPDRRPPPPDELNRILAQIRGEEDEVAPE
jgi:hypothetical protein